MTSMTWIDLEKAARAEAVGGTKSAPSTSSKPSDLAAKARAEFDATRKAAFIALAKDHGGVNAQNRPAIEEQARKAGQYAASTVYLAAGYAPCKGTGCDRLCTPGYALCPACAKPAGNR